ncbi:hypothetical protein ANN_21970 [Periplaneta americana]|uniref:Uncharacterized protein n=1 Tax=Periplaneta americana TaxID=6978 RepID=A0ABQ8S7A1_PERAM|nr:hypothetical protein ANN_21970 [Periplaneta americana]
MAGLCEGGNEPSGSLKAICNVTSPGCHYVPAAPSNPLGAHNAAAGGAVLGRLGLVWILLFQAALSRIYWQKKRDVKLVSAGRASAVEASHIAGSKASNHILYYRGDTLQNFLLHLLVCSNFSSTY